MTWILESVITDSRARLQPRFSVQDLTQAREGNRSTVFHFHIFFSTFAAVARYLSRNI